MKKKILVVGSGLYGAVFARQLASHGFKVDVIEKRNHIGGNCYTEKVRDIPIHMYGPHAFHTNSQKVWDYVQNFVKFNDYKLNVKVNYNNRLYSFPINLFTINQVFGAVGIADAKKAIKNSSKKVKATNFKNQIISTMGSKIYKIFFEGYTKKQWNIDPTQLSASVAKRIPIRFDYNDNYFTDIYQGIPVGGYTVFFENLLDHKNIHVDLNSDFFENKKTLEKKYDKIIYSGKIDELFEYKYGLLQYRSLNFRTKVLQNTFLGHGAINFTSEKVPYTRIIEHKYFAQMNCKHTVVTYEYPQDYKIGSIPFYPMPTEKNQSIYEKYAAEAEQLDQYVIGGRLGRYKYLNMDQVIAMALTDSEKLLEKNKV